METKDEKEKIVKKIKAFYLRFKENRNRKRIERLIKKLRKSKSKNLEFAESLLEESSKEWKINRSKETAIKFRAYFAILLGCILLLGTLCVNIYFSTKALDARQKIILDAITNIINIVISMVVGIGVSTIVLDFFSYVQYTRERLKEIIVDKPFIKKLSDEEKRNIIFKAEESLYFKDGKITPNSLYADVKKKITPLLDTCYFSDYSMTVFCDIDKNSGICKKEILKNMKIISNDDDVKFQLPFAIYLRKTDDGKIKKTTR